jgi:hypothetical protein
MKTRHAWPLHALLLLLVARWCEACSAGQLVSDLTGSCLTCPVGYYCPGDGKHSKRGAASAHVYALVIVLNNLQARSTPAQSDITVQQE